MLEVNPEETRAGLYRRNSLELRSLWKWRRMQYTAYYIIRPRPALEQMLRGIEDLETLLEPELWTTATVDGPS